MVELGHAQELLCNSVDRISRTKLIPLKEALGFRLAEDAIAKEHQPPFPRSPLDGYAIKGKNSKGATRENPRTLRVIGKVYAGYMYDGVVGEGEAVRIMTGAPIPEGADTVIRQEATDYGECEVKLYQEEKPYAFYCPMGEDYRKGDCLIKKGVCINAAAISILASLGYENVLVYEKPVIAVIATGDEIILPGMKQQPGKIYDSNLYYITSRLKEMGFDQVIADYVDDDVSKMVKKIETVSQKADLIITTGGVSVGEKDIMHEVIKCLKAKKMFWKVALKPGGPTLAAVYEKVSLVCLSGNPFGAVANFELLIRPMLEKMTNMPIAMKKTKAIMTQDLNKKCSNKRFLRGYVKGNQVRLSKGTLVSGALSAILDCNCLIELEMGKGYIKKGEDVWIHIL